MLTRPPLVSSPSLSRLLRFIVEETVAGRGGSITESTLGVQVFRRGEDFNPRADPIVRVQAHHLRARLASYYSGPGANDPVRIELPARTYVPVFRVVAPPKVAEPALAAPAAGAGNMRGAALVTVIVALVSVAAMAVLWRTYRPPNAAAVAGPSPAAQDLYVRGRYLMDRQSEAAIREGIDCFQRAAGLDPHFAAALAGLADANNLLAQYGYVTPSEGMEPARSAARHALELDGGLAEAHVALAAILEAYDWNWAAAELEYRRAIALNPALPAAHLWYGMFLRDQGRLQEALPEFRTAERLQPLSVVGSSNFAIALWMAGDQQAALEQARRAVDLDPKDPLAALLLADIDRKRSDAAGAAAAAEQARALSPGNPHAQALLACLYARMGRRDDSLRLYAELQQVAAGRYVSPFDLGNVSLALGDQDRAVSLFEEALRQRSAGMVYLRNLRAGWMRSSPRMQSLIDKIHAG